MDVLLIGIAALSLILTIGMGLILFKTLNEERQRSDARVAALAAAASNIELPLPADADEWPPAVHIRSKGDLFVSEDSTSPWPRRAAVAAGVAALLAVAGYALVPSHTSTPPALTATVPLELLALTHRQEGTALTITGSVRNPRDGAAQGQVFATAVLFGADGNFLTNSRAALDFTALAPGDESPFVLTVPVTGTVARYRIGFRNAAGSVIAHVDRRADATTAAQRRDNSGSTPWAH
jgi:hypothetical protein